MKILMTTDTVGGVWTYCMELCRELQRYNATIHLVTMGGNLNGWQRHEVKQLENVELHETNFILEWMQRPWFDIEECSEWLLRMEDEIQPDVIHLNCFAYGCLPFKAPKVVVAHSDVYSWFLSVKRDDPPTEWQKYYWCVRNGLKGADMIVAPSQWMLEFVNRIYYATDNQQVIYNGRSSDLFYSEKKEDFIMSMGRIWDDAKNIKLLVNAAPMINTSIKIAGDNQFAENSFDLTFNNIEYLGKLPPTQIAKHLSAASVYVLPAKYEPFGLSVLEAAFSKCALVLGEIESLKEIWGDNALYVDTSDKHALAETINYLMENPDVREEMGQKAYKHAQKYSIETMASGYMKVYKQLITNVVTENTEII